MVNNIHSCRSLKAIRDTFKQTLCMLFQQILIKNLKNSTMFEGEEVVLCILFPNPVY